MVNNREVFYTINVPICVIYTKCGGVDDLSFVRFYRWKFNDLIEFKESKGHDHNQSKRIFVLLTLNTVVKVFGKAFLDTIYFLQYLKSVKIVQISRRFMKKFLYGENVWVVHVQKSIPSDRYFSNKISTPTLLNIIGLQISENIYVWLCIIELVK